MKAKANNALGVAFALGYTDNKPVKEKLYQRKESMSDDISELKRQAEANIHLFLEVDGSGKGYICPFCKSGSGKKGTGITTHVTLVNVCCTIADALSNAAAAATTEETTAKGSSK